ncbi:hypothetical protein ACKWTF_011177 [Chironomus riparius]
MKAIYLLSLFFLSASAVINQEAQRREAPAYPQREYGPPQRQPARNLHAMQRLIAAMRNGGHNGQARVVNRPQPIPVRNTYGPPAQQPVARPQQSYGAPAAAGGYSSSSGSLEAFTHNHNPDVRCDGWIPIPGPSIPHSAGGSASSGSNVDTSYGPPKHNSGGSLSIVVPEDTSYSSGSSSASSGSIDTSYGVPQPPSNPQREYGPPPSSNSIGSGSSSSFGGSSSHSFGSGSSGSFGSIDTSYGPPQRQPHSNYGPPTAPPAPIAPQHSYGPPSHSFGGGSSASSGSIDTSFGVPQPPSNPQKEYGPPATSHSSGSGSLSSFGSSSSNSFGSGSIDTSYGVPQPPSNPQREYGPPATSHSSGSGSSSSFGSSSSHSFGSGSSGSFGGLPEPRRPQNNYGPPVPPAPPAPIAPVPISPHNTYGAPNSFASGSSASSGSFANQEISFNIPQPAPVAPQNSYGPPAPKVIPIAPQNSYGPPSHSSNGGLANSIHTPDNSYGPPIIVGSGHASSASAIASIDNSYGPPNHQPAPENNYLPPQALTSSGHSSSSSVSSNSNSYSGPPPIGHLTYGVPKNPQDFGPPESSYGPPPSGLVEFKHSGGHDGTIDTVPNLPTDIQLPIADSGAHFDNAIGFVSSTLGVSANSEVIKSQAIHESHTSELATSNSFSSGSGFSAGSSDSYSAPPLDSYAPGKYPSSYNGRKPAGTPQRPIAPQRPISPPRPNYGPPIPTKTVRPQAPPPNFRPLNNYAQSVAQSYSSQSHSIQQTPVRPIRPLIHRQPVPQGLIQSIGQNVKVQDALGSSHGLSGGKTYLPPPTNEVPIPPMRLIVPNPGPVQQFQHNSHNSHSQAGGVATSSSSFSLQNQDLRHIHVIHDCGKGPKLQNTYGAPSGGHTQTFQAPLVSESHSAVLSAGYEVPAQALEVPQHNSINFNAPSNSYGPPSNSYGPPASGPGHLEVVGLESRNNAVVSELTQSESRDTPRAQLPGLNSGLSSSGLDFISAIKSHSIEVPQNQGSAGNFQLQIQGSQSHDNRIDGTNHKQILDDGLLQSILTAIEQKPAQTVPQVTEDAESEHTEAKTFLKSREGQQVLGDKTSDAKKN